MYIDREHRNPPNNGAYQVFGTVNQGTPYETQCRFTAYWDSGLEMFLDKDGDDFTGINEGVTHWFDFNYIAAPDSRVSRLN